MKRSELKSKALGEEEVKSLSSWFDNNKDSIPKDIQSSLEVMLLLYKKLAQDSEKSKDLLKAMREAMGIIGKSEKGRNLTKHGWGATNS